MLRYSIPAVWIAVAIGASAYGADAQSTGHYTIKDDAIVFTFAATDQDMVVLDTLPDLKSITFGGMEAWDGPDPRTLKWAITDKGFAHFASCRKVGKLYLSSIHELNLTDASVAHLSEMKDLEELLLDSNEKLGDGSLQAISGLNKLRVLRFYGAPITDAGIAKISALTELADLQLGRSNVGDDAMKTIGTFKHLNTLDLQHTRVTDTGVEKLKGLQLHWICLNGTSVTSKGIEALADMKQLQWLFLEQTHVDDAAMETAAKMPLLESLYVSDTKVTDAGVAKLAGHGHLSSLKVDNLPLTDASVDTLLTVKTLTNIQMNGTHITADGEKRLKDAGIIRINKQ